jgi:hypothetical protein
VQDANSAANRRSIRIKGRNNAVPAASAPAMREAITVPDG